MLLGHLLREIDELRARHPDDQGLATWATAVHALSLEATVCGRPRRGGAGQAACEQRLLARCQPVVAG